ncbi:MAG TPA: Fic family protein [Pseudolabrys sp.]
MLDNNWDLINGPAAHQIEQLNGANVINLIEAIVVWSMAHQLANQLPPMPNALALSELHRTGTLFLLATPGKYRQSEVNVQNILTGQVVHQPPIWQEVNQHMTEFFQELDTIWKTGDALDAASFSLWRINWIHPFKNGNGRTARAFCYACLCARLKAILPGAPTVIDQIMMTRPEYESALRVGDVAAKQDKAARDLSAMRTYLDDLLQKQMATVT